MMRAVKRKEKPIEQGRAEWADGSNEFYKNQENGTSLSGRTSFPEGTLSPESMESDLLGRIVVAAGIFLLLFLAGRLLHFPSQETVQAWVSSDAAYERAVDQAAAWIEGRLKQESAPEE